MITIDTEVWPRCRDWREDGLRGDIARDMYGVTPAGHFGVKYQAKLLHKYGLKAVFFLESLFACEVGIEPLAGVVEMLQSYGHEVQLHPHVEWLEWLTDPPVPSRRVHSIKGLSLEEQELVMRRSIANLEAAGVENVCAFRAGNFGGNRDTLRALARCGVRYDSSYNYPFLGGECEVDVYVDDEHMLVQPRELEGVIEVPVNCFRDYPGHFRPTQLCAISQREMRQALTHAHAHGWFSFVVVSHSFELLRDRKHPRPYAQPDWEVIRRFEGMCRFLAGHRERFTTVGFCDLSALPQADPEPLRPSMPGTLVRTAERMVRQIARRAAR